LIKLGIVDDQKIFRETLKYILEQDKEIEVVGCAGDGNEALELCDKCLPDVLLMDIGMPVCDGVEGTEKIKLKYKTVKVIILTTFGDAGNVALALQKGADGYILKEVDSGELISAIKSTAKGLSVIHKSVLNVVTEQMSTKTEPPGSLETSKAVDLNEKELEIIKLIVDGKSNREISKELGLTEGTIKNLVSELLWKLKLRDRTQLAVFALRHNLI
jgi:DNA-binding NarL/FixJ family response regulator